MFDDYNPFLRVILVTFQFSILVFTFIFLFNFLSVNENSTYYLQSVVLDNNFEGSFVLGTGMLNGESYYIAYEIQSDGGKILKKYDADSVIVYDTLEHGDTPYLKKSISGFLGTNVEIKLYVPKDTIDKNLDIDLSNLK
jgi:hypothetical protein